jgi:GT2 family glycosyltransferase/glycosyltransferase involved in cell wall biosynthesis
MLSRKQSELIRVLRKQLEAKERELADAKWVFERFQESPSWKLTAPLRWIARKLRPAKTSLTGAETVSARSRYAVTPQIEVATSGEAEDQFADQIKQAHSSLFRLSLESFLTSGQFLHLPNIAAPDVSIIIVLFNRSELTLACLRSIHATYHGSIEVILVDNASSDETSRLLSKVTGAKIIRNAENRHFLLSANQAAKLARGRHILLLNSDAQLLPGTLDAALETMRSAPDIGAVGARIVRLDGTLQEAGSIIWRDGSCLGYGRDDHPDSWSYMFRRDVDYCSGAFLLTPRATWEKLGGFDETFAPAYYEETDYCMRLWENGLRTVYEPAAVILHYEFGSAAPATALELQAEHQKIFAQRHSSALQQHHTSDTSVLAARTHLRGGKTSRHVLVLDDRVPHPCLGSGYPRARTMLVAMQRLGCVITFYPMMEDLFEEWSTVYADFPRDIEVINEMGPTLLEAFVRDRRGYYDTLVVSRPHNMNALKAVMREYPDGFKDMSIIYDAEALFAPRDIGVRRLQGEPLSEQAIQKIYEDEVALAGLADRIIAVSEMDRSTFQNYGINRVDVLGHSLEPAPTQRPFHDRSGFLFVGAIHEEASPNGDSIIWFLTEIWPRIQAKLGPAATFTIVGLNKSERIRSLAGNGIVMLDRVQELTSMYDRVRVFVAPTRFAAGLPHKVHEAAARGVPVVGTPVLAQQLGWEDGIQFGVGADAETFADRCIQLHEREQLWRKIREAGIAAVQRECSPDLFEKQLQAILAAEPRPASRRS